MDYAAELKPFQEKVFHFLKETNFFKGVVYDEEKGSQCLTIYGYWRIIKRVDASGAIIHSVMRRCEENYLEWEDVPQRNVPLRKTSKKQLGIPEFDWPLGSVPLFYRGENLRYIFSDAIFTALNKTFKISGFNHLFPNLDLRGVHKIDDFALWSKQEKNESIYRGLYEELLDSYEKERPSKRYITYAVHGKNGVLPWPIVYKYTTFGKVYAIIQSRQLIHAKMFLSLFWKKMVDRPLYRVANLSAPHIPTLATYIGFSQNREPAVALLNEKPNMVPFLNFLPIDDWGRSDILSSKRWIHSLKARNKKNLSFVSPGSYKLIQRLTPDSVSRICNIGNDRYNKNSIPKFVDALVHAQIAPKIPAQFIKIVLNFYFICSELPFSSTIIRLAGREFLRLKGKRAYLPKNEATNFIHLLDSIEDMLHNVNYNVHKNTTWQSLVRDAAEWHRIIIEEMQSRKIREMGASADATWTDPLGEAEFQIPPGIIVRPLVSPAALIQEGMEMKHCIQQDSWRCSCQAGYMWCYSLTHQASLERSTLAISEHFGNYQIAQHRGIQNCDPGESMEEAAKYLLGLFIKTSKGATLNFQSK